MKVVCLVGPFRAENAWETEQNVRRAEDAALQLWRLGLAVLCPHTNTRFFQGAAPDELWLAGSGEFVRRADAVVVLAGASTSRGSQQDLEVARERALPVYRWPEDIVLVIGWAAEPAA